MHAAVAKLPTDGSDVPWVWPLDEGGLVWNENEAAAFADDTAALPWVQKIGLNVLQKTAVVGILRCARRAKLRSARAATNEPERSPPFVIFGPPGTGKTVTVVEAAWQLLQADPTSKVLLCAPSNAAADVLCDRLRMLGLSSDDLHRFCWASRKLEFVLPRLLPYCAQSSEGQLAYLPGSMLRSKRVIVCTCFSAGILAERGLAHDHFSAVIIDEAGQASEPETLVPLSNFAMGPCGGSRTVTVLAGDPLQLGAVCRSPHAKRLGYTTSLLERLMHLPLYASQDAQGRLITKLLNNYRSHAQILHMSSSAFYKNELRACADPRETDTCLEWDVIAETRFPVVFFGVEGEAVCPAESASPFNRFEASQVADLVENLLRSRLTITAADFGVVAPYRNQVAQQCL
jgi:helicase MOV-10